MLSLKIISDNSPMSAHGAVANVDGNIYYHGGITKRGSIAPVNELHWFNPSTGVWTLLSDDGPPLSHHAVMVTENRYLNFVGGWDGRARLADVNIFDIKYSKWLRPPMCEGFPTGGGLSSHSATPLANGSAIVIGRLGGLRMQRRTSAVLKLSGSYNTGFTYKSYDIPIMSRSGHTATAIASDQCVVLGGRHEPHRGMDAEMLRYRAFSKSNFSGISVKRALSRDTAMTFKNMVVSRRYHVAVADASGRILVHGGESFDHLMPNESFPRSDVSVWTEFPIGTRTNNNSITKPKENKGAKPGDNGIEGCWHKVVFATKRNHEPPPPKLAAHCAVAHNRGIMIFGGYQDGWKLNRNTYDIAVVDD